MSFTGHLSQRALEPVEFFYVMFFCCGVVPNWSAVGDFWLDNRVVECLNDGCV